MYLKDWMWAITACFTCWFRKNSVLERRLHFLDTGLPACRKARRSYALLTRVYKLKIERGYPYRFLKPEEFICGTKCEIRYPGEYDTEICRPTGYEGKEELTNDIGWCWFPHKINPETLQFLNECHAENWLRIKNKIWHKALRY